MSKSRRNRAGGPERRRIFSGPGEPPLRSLWQRARCCGATIAADPARMGRAWADVHEPGCPAPWEALGLDGPARDVYPGAPYLPDVPWLSAVNRRPGPAPAHRAALRRQA
jgi:hypothetical protein